MPMDGDFMGDQDMPQPPQDNNQVPAPKAPEYFVVVEEKEQMANLTPTEQEKILKLFEKTIDYFFLQVAAWYDTDL